METEKILCRWEHVTPGGERCVILVAPDPDSVVLDFEDDFPILEQERWRAGAWRFVTLRAVPIVEGRPMDPLSEVVGAVSWGERQPGVVEGKDSPVVVDEVSRLTREAAANVAAWLRFASAVRGVVFEASRVNFGTCDEERVVDQVLAADGYRLWRRDHLPRTEVERRAHEAMRAALDAALAALPAERTGRWGWIDLESGEIFSPARKP